MSTNQSRPTMSNQDRIRATAADDARNWLQNNVTKMAAPVNPDLVVSLGLLLVHYNDLGFSRACEATKRVARDWPQSRPDGGLALALALAADDLGEIEDYFDNRADADADCDRACIPNEELQLLQSVRRVQELHRRIAQEKKLPATPSGYGMIETMPSRRSSRPPHVSGPFGKAMWKP